ncbi:MAG: T7SS effector LXG polymorphic toxin, partial [Rickettsia endosymbiont of Ixodes persulcatus]|nr:T7SS effector LXG polymorphic toxin [Rickettsia endosymbiont of Ixodes persulcatus]
DVVEAWLGLIDRHIAFFNSIPGDIIDADLNESIVTVPFLEEELVTANHNAKEMVRAQKTDLKAILGGIHDIIQLEPFSDEGFLENIEKAEKKRTKTINKVHKLDHKWTTEYAESEEDLDAVVALMEQLKESSTRGGETSPLYFNSSSYKNSEVFKNVEVRKKENEEYLKVKKEEADKRLMKDLKVQLDSVTNPEEFLKIANKIGYESLEPSQQQYVLQVETSKQTIEIAKGVGVGLYDAGKDFVVGTWNFVTNPGEILGGMANSIIHPVQTYKYISKSIKDSYERDMVNGDAYSRAHWVSYGLGTVATSVVGTKGAGAVTKTGIATTKTVAVKGTAKAKELSGSITNLLPYNPRNQLELAGGVPYNAVNGAGLKDQLITMAKKELGVKVNSGKKFNLDTMKHIYHGEINRRGKAVGYHHESMMGGKIIPGSKSKPDKNGVYKAKVEIDGEKKIAYSTFFPKDWDRVKVNKAISEAFENKTREGNRYVGRTSSGIDIGLFLKSDGSIATAFPLYKN